ncbi:Uncharacterised protein [Chromobacterium violaceum]|uniref:Uncharacterized protein n=1 Tax=Chromobacterium violaceum TaxID=536 RepID=A0A447TAL9_CHRVL|nr:Uncharacterised protein [Chromobacterium violaceum]
MRRSTSDMPKPSPGPAGAYRPALSSTVTQSLPSAQRAAMRMRPASSSWEVPCLIAFSTMGCSENAGSRAWRAASSSEISTSSLPAKRASSMRR